MAITLKSYGACMEVTGSAHCLEIDGKKYLIDCGLFQGKELEAEKKNKDFNIPVNEIESVVLTHAHADHSCRLPLMAKNGYSNAIYSTPATRDLAAIVMEDSAKIQMKECSYSKKNPKTPLYIDKDAHAAIKLFKPLSYNKEKQIADNLILQFYNAGHILGSSLASLTIKDYKPHISLFSKIFGKKAETKDLNILFTGDLGRPNRSIIKEPETNVGKPDYIVLESTYGNRKHEKLDVGIEKLETIINETFANKGKIIIPCFALERCQEIILYLRKLYEEKRISKKIPVYLDSPMSINATQVFNLHPEAYNDDMKKSYIDKGKDPFSFSQLFFVNKIQESKLLDKKDEPMIIISASGMMTNGPVVNHLKNLLSNPTTTVVVAGFQAEETLGRRLLEGDKEVTIEKSKYTVNARIEKIESFSSHADYEETINWLKSIDTSNLKKIFLVHGDKEAQDGLKEHLGKAGFKNVESILPDKTYKLSRN